ncbi:helix-turn-helix domain-containing protein [Cellulomonas denverensis]|uniref:Helix-turn-helix transcriptional regulator n=1 Tax=Cellulomonas denverensis TaxID=264297 RepID=A0A7X6KTJ0_9CELL|nr:helix-turn-helix transcriptional regulator [Cellulomonas denverensis]NKY21733.1 helix-turn-helix transcriptional regulator [Cellulomonas denverensis]GIG25608.1 transcriptional regulator [Cellulomonas denverensis]
MSHKDDVREFLISRRAQVTPEQAGLTVYGDDRRVPGLRREEVAELAGVSLDYYVRLERGNIAGASDEVLHAIAGALRLDEVERRHLFDLARRAPARVAREGRTAGRLRPSVRRMLDALSVPALVTNACQDILGANPAGAALFAPHLESERPNLARFIFLDSRAPEFYADWPLACRLTAAMLRYRAGRDPLNEDLTALIGELSTRSPRFRQDWADHDVHEHRTGRKLYRHPVVGEIDLTYDVLELPGEPGLSITTYTVDPGSESERRLARLPV